MKGIERREDFEPAIVMAELARQLKEAFIGLGAAIAKKALARADETDERLSQPALCLVVIEIGNVDELARLLDQGLGNRRVGMAQRADRNAAAQIQIALASDIIEVAS